MPPEKIVEEIETECSRIEQLFQDYDPLLEKIKDQEPDFFEIGSLAMLLHSFYNGLENIFSRIARKIDKNLPDGKEWHKELLDLMTKRTEKRGHVVLSDRTHEELKEYLGFRHFSRHGYAFDLSRDLMKDLVLMSDDIKGRAIAEIKLFIGKFIGRL